MKKLKRDIKIGGVDFEQRFYYVRDENGKPAVTVCVLNTPDFSEITRGVCICTRTDQVDKMKYKKKAAGRARLALHTKTSSEPVAFEKALDVLSDVGLIEDNNYVLPKTELGESILHHGKSAYLTGNVENGITEKEAHLIKLPVEEKAKVAEA